MAEFDLAQTQALAELFETPREARDDAWQTKFYAAVPDATLMGFDPQVNVGPDSFPYFHMAIPDPGPVTPFCVTHVLDFVLDNGIGIVIFGDSSRSEGPQWVFTYGDLLSYSMFGDFAGDPATRDKEPAAGSGQMLVASPSESYLPERARKAIGEYARRIFQMPAPKIALIDNGASRSLMINLQQKQYGGDENKIRAAMHYLGWFLPRGYRMMPMPDDWDDSAFTAI